MGRRMRAVGELRLAIHGLHVFPAEAAALGAAVGVLDGAFAVGAAGLARQADADQAPELGEDDTAVDVIPSIALIALHYRELHAVDQQQFVQREAQRLRHQHINFQTSAIRRA